MLTTDRIDIGSTNTKDRITGIPLFATEELTAQGGDTLNAEYELPAGVTQMTFRWVLIKADV